MGQAHARVDCNRVRHHRSTKEFREERDDRRRSNDEALDRGAFGRIRSRPDRDESPRASGRPRRGHLREGSGAQGVTALVPVMECTTLPPWELSANCYNNLLSAGANCYYETNVMIQFFNETGILDTATTAVKTGDADEDTLKSLPTEDEFKQEAIDWIPTGREKLQAITGSPDINPICCQAITKLVDDKCACEETAMTAVNKRLDKIGMNVQDWLDLAKQVVKGMGCDGADNLQAYPECT